MWLSHKGSGREKCFLSKSRHQWDICDMLGLGTLARKLMSLLVPRWEVRKLELSPQATWHRPALVVQTSVV